MEKEKLIAMYLPQFHQVPENDEWWGEGFTDWEAVKAGVPLFDGHIQPKKPLNGYYYDLSDKETLQWQSDLMRKYSVDGLCFYHYYFKDGRKILQKPAENLLKWKDIDIPYCFCWANESWARTWSNIGNKNAWIAKFEKTEDKEKDVTGILLEQKYGREEEWKRHFEYLLPFLEDERYIKVAGAPVFLIYKPNEIYCLPQMLDYWRELARKKNESEIYFIGLNSLVPRKGLDAVLINAPTMFFNSAQKGANLTPYWRNGVKTYQYEDIWNEILSSEQIEGCTTFFGGLVNSDGTPRHGKNVSMLNGFSIEKFRTYLYLLMIKNRRAGNEFTFINAWNEWGEGAYLEPDEEYGYQYLDAVKEVKTQMEKEDSCFLIDNYKLKLSKTDCKTEAVSSLNKYKWITNCLDNWMSLRENSVSLADYLKRYHYNEVAVYGIGILGKHLLYELNQAGVKVSYAIDCRSDLQYPNLEIKNSESDLDEVDAVIITAVADYDEIYEKLKKKLNCPVLSLMELISELQ